MQAVPEVDVAIVGGSYAGLAAALALGRARRRVVVIDSGQPCNRQTPHSHNFLTLDGATPAHIQAVAQAQVLAYPTVELRPDTVTDITGASNDFTVFTASGRSVWARKILLATGVRDLLLPIPGFAECWGISVIHCPYCHGYEYGDQPTGVLTNGPATVDFAKLIRNWSRALTVFTNGAPTFSPEQEQQLAALGVRVEFRAIRQLVHTNGRLERVEFTEGEPQALAALYARVPFEQHFPLPAALPCALTEAGYIQADEFRHTSVPGVFAAGDNGTMLRSVAVAVAAGAVAGAGLNHELLTEEA